jgi:biopolymer transport protein ExbD
MGMNVGSSSASGEPEVLMDVNTTPLIDVMLVLLVMLIITIPIQLHTVNLDMPPPSTTPPPSEPVVHTVMVDFDGTVYWDETALPNQAAVDAKMQEIGAMNQRAARNPHQAEQARRLRCRCCRDGLGPAQQRQEDGHGW